MKPFEQIEIGERIELGVWDVTAADTIAFASRYDPQAFHLSEDAASRTYFGRLSASGWQTAATWMRLMLAWREREQAAALARGEPVAQMGPSPGFEAMKWLRPVYPGDRITYFSTVTSKRISESRPQWGVVQHFNEGVNQDGVQVFSFVGTVFVGR